MYTYTRNALFYGCCFHSPLCVCVNVQEHDNINRHERKKQGKAIEHKTLSYIIIEQKTLSSFGRDSNLHTPGLYDIVLESITLAAQLSELNPRQTEAIYTTTCVT